MLNEEIAAFEARLPQMLATHGGEFAVFKGGEAQHFSVSYASAVDWAYARFGLEPFLVRQVTTTEPTVHFTRPLASCGR